MSLENIKRNQTVTLTIPAARPIRTLDGTLHEAGQSYRVLGSHGTCVRLSRTTDKAKLIISPESISQN